MHILPGVNNRTLYKPSAQTTRIPVINKYINTIKNLNDSKARDEIRFDSLTFYICILTPFCIIANKIYKKDIADIDTKLKLKYKIASEGISITDSNWSDIIKAKDN